MKKCLRRTLPYLLPFLLLHSSAYAFEQTQNGKIHSIESNGTLQVLFTPEDNATRQIVLAIEQAQKQVLVQTYSFTSREIAQALIVAKQRGIDVQIIADAEQTNKIEFSKVPSIAAGGVPVFIDSLHSSAHNKVMIIDTESTTPIVITGSFNFTHAAQYKNAENLLIFRSNQALTAAYLENWQRHREHAQPFGK